jgi:hypothetical protein
MRILLWAAIIITIILCILAACGCFSKRWCPGDPRLDPIDISGYHAVATVTIGCGADLK